MATIGTSAKAWDDTALLNSWEATLAEYEKYHSIQARGEKVEDVLEAYELEQLKQERREQGQGTPSQQEDQDYAENAYKEENGSYEDATVSTTETDQAPPLVQMQQPNPRNQPDQPNYSAAPNFSGLPQMVDMPGDDALKNVMMSWYYAGYYTGLYEGQQKTQQVNNDGAH